jgi:hypothetical protein
MVREAIGGAECLRGGLEHEAGVAKRRERDPEDPVRVAVGCGCGRLDREPGLPGSPGPEQGEQAHVVAAEKSRSCMSSRSRPMNGVAGIGKFVR